MSISPLSTFPEEYSRIVMTPRVLIIEDNTVIRNLYYRSLLSAGFAVMPAANNLQAKALLTEFKPTIILLDLELPDLDSNDLLTTMTAETAGTAPTIVGFSTQDQRQYSGELHYAHFLYKPVSLMTLVDLVRQVSAERAARS